jgi:hypothetical protein
MISNTKLVRNLGVVLLSGVLSVLFLSGTIKAQQEVLRLMATSAANVTPANESVTISILRWSTDEERDAVSAAAPPPSGAAAAPAAPAAPAPAAPRGGGGGRGGRGEGAAPPDPRVVFSETLQKMPTVGYIWVADSSLGYLIKYARRISTPGGERIILATNRDFELKPAGTSTPAVNPFTLIELRLDSNGTGQGKTSFASTVAIDTAAGTLALADYNAGATVLTNIRR